MFHYVYPLESFDGQGHRYVGLTGDLRERLRKHNAGEVSHTSTYRPWKMSVAVAFADVQKAATFERYLKSHSGRAFAKKHF